MTSEIGALDRLTARLLRRLELLRGRVLCWRGTHAGARFGVGPGVRIFYPRCLTIGDNVTIEGSAYLHCLSERGVHIGSHSSFGPNFWLHCGGTPQNSDLGYFRIGEKSFIGCNAVIGAGGGITIGNDVLIAPNVTLISEEHCFTDVNAPIRKQGVVYKNVIINDNVWIGACVKILAGVTIGEGAVIGAGAVVTHDIPSYAVAVGVPARVIHLRE